MLHSPGLTPPGYFLSPYGLAAKIAIRRWADAPSYSTSAPSGRVPRRSHTTTIAESPHSPPRLPPPPSAHNPAYLPHPPARGSAGSLYPLYPSPSPPES